MPPDTGGVQLPRLTLAGASTTDRGSVTRIGFGIAAIASLGAIAAPAAAQPGSNNPVVAAPNITRSQVGLGNRSYDPNSHPWYHGEAARFHRTHRDLVSRYESREEARFLPGQRELARALDRDQYSAALASATPLAEAGDAFAKRHLGWMYLRGVGVAKDREAGLNLLREAALLGDEPAALALALVYKGRYGVARDLKQARFWRGRAEASQDEAIRNEAKRLRYRD